MLHYYGNVGFGASILLTSMAFWGVATLSGVRGTSNPCTYLERYLQGRYPAVLAASLVVAQFAGGIIAMKTLARIQELELTVYHSLQVNSFCVCDLNVSVVFGFFIEGAGVVLGNISDDVTLVPTEWLDVALKTVVDVWITLYGMFHVSFGY